MFVLDSDSNNKFVQLALENTIKLAIELKGILTIQPALSHGIDIIIVGDNDFYSQRATVSVSPAYQTSLVVLIGEVYLQLASMNLPRTWESLNKIKPFANTGVSLPDVHKTGLGSSAALITSLVSALLVHLSVLPASALASVKTGLEIMEQPITQHDVDGRKLAHNLAQYVHCLAQGKIGSGFDVSAAVFGSHMYTRFEPAVLQTLMDGSPVCPTRHKESTEYLEFSRFYHR